MQYSRWTVYNGATGFSVEEGHMLVRLGEVLTAELLVTHAEHIRDFLALEGVHAAAELGETQLTERVLKELLEELAEAH
jgi:hypothetical protein